MRIFLDSVNRRLLVPTNILAILTVGPCAILVPQRLAAQQGGATTCETRPRQFSMILVARVALYPDPLLAQVMASADFRRTDFCGNAVGSAAQEPKRRRFGPGHGRRPIFASIRAVQSLLAFPSVLDLMNKDLAWTQKLGDATLVQRGDVMDAVQRMRKKAFDAGNLKSSQQITVVQSAPQVIKIQSPSPTVIYVPTYSPQVVYAPAPPPPPGPSTGAVVAAAAVGFMVGVALSNSYCNSYWGHHGGFGWSSHTVIVHNSAWGRTWGNHGSYTSPYGGTNRGFYAKTACLCQHERLRSPQHKREREPQRKCQYQYQCEPQRECEPKRQCQSQYQRQSEREQGRLSESEPPAGTRTTAARPPTARAATHRTARGTQEHSQACRMADRNRQPRRAGKPAAGNDYFSSVRTPWRHAKPHTFHLGGFQAAALVTLAAFLLGPGTSLTKAADQKTFPTPNAAVASLIAAVKTRTTDQVLAILGPELATFTALPAINHETNSTRQMFLDASRILKLEKQGDDPNTVIAYLGRSEWPFPAPLVKTSTGWKFDGKTAVQEIKDRQIGRNELGVVDFCQVYL